MSMSVQHFTRLKTGFIALAVFTFANLFTSCKKEKRDPEFKISVVASGLEAPMGIESDWLKWWELSPSLTQDEVYSDVGNLRKADSGMALRANKISRYFKRCLDEVSVKEDSEEKKRALW